MSNLELAQAKFTRADKILRWMVGFFLLFSATVFIFVGIQLYQVQSTIAANQTKNSAASDARFKRYTADNATQHEKTQKYVRCIALVLLEPIEKRTDAVFDQCSAPALD